MKLLAIDTSTDACSCALYADGAVSGEYSLAPQGHAELVLQMVQRVLGASGCTLAELDGLAFGRGPGSFTGVRIAAGVVQGLALGAELPVVAVSSLRAMAQGCYRDGGAAHILAALDARMDEVYWGAFEATPSGIVTPVGDEQVCAPALVRLRSLEHAWAGAGSGWLVHEERLRAALDVSITRLDLERYPDAHDVALIAAQEFECGSRVHAADALPVYLRNEVAVRPGGASKTGR